MHVGFEAEQAQQLECSLDLLRRGMAVVERAHFFVQALDAHLDFGAAHATQCGQVSGRYALRPCFYYQAYYAVLPVDIGILLGFELFPRCLLPLAHRRPRTIFAVETVECLVVRCFSVVDTMLLFGNECLKEFRVARDPCRFVGMLARREVLDRLGAIVQCGTVHG